MIDTDIICPVHKEKMKLYCVEQHGVEIDDGVIDTRPSLLGNYMETRTGSSIKEKTLYCFRCSHGCEFSSLDINEVTIPTETIRVL